MVTGPGTGKTPELLELTSDVSAVSNGILLYTGFAYPDTIEGAIFNLIAVGTPDFAPALSSFGRLPQATRVLLYCL